LGALATPRPAQAQCGADVHGTNKQVGGGEGYASMVSRSQADFVVATRDELVAALSSALPGDIIYVEDDATIDLIPPNLPAAEWQLTIPEDVTLASGRGQAGSVGGLLYVDRDDIWNCSRAAGGNYCDDTSAGFFRVSGAGVRITGLRLSGSDLDTVVGKYEKPLSDAVYVDGEGTLEVDNCELSGFSHGGVYANGTVIDIHHNHIHHNRRSGLGYGVVLAGAANAIVESNVLDHNRHDVAGTGDPRQNYYARYNLVIGEGRSHAFDMHGENERADKHSGYAGGEIVIEFNTFVDDGVDAVKFRGAPYVFGYVDNNVFTHAASAFDAFQQNMYTETMPYENGLFGVYDFANPGPMPAEPTDGFERARQSNNCADYTGWFRYEPRYGGFFPLAKSTAGVSSLAFGDFDGDGKADTFKTDGTRWHISSGAVESWAQVATASQTLSSLAFGNFVGDGRTDVFRASGGKWYASDAANGTWTQLASSSFGLSDLRFGNFVGDSRTDVFRTSGSAWYVSDGGTGSWQQLNSSSTTLSSLAFGDFVGDSRTDIFRATGSVWQVSDGGAGTWQNLANSSSTLSTLAFGNVVGDSKTDVLRVSGGKWYVSDGGKSSWTLFADFAHGSYALSALRFADFTGDGTDDVFFSGKP
jgi:hypothetical protein